MDRLNKLKCTEANLNLVYKTKKNFYIDQLKYFDKILIDYYTIIFLWEKKKFLNKFNLYSLNLVKIEDSFFKSNFFFESLNFYNKYLKNIYYIFFNFLLGLHFNLNKFFINCAVFDNISYINKFSVYKFYLYILNNGNSFNYLKSTLYSISLFINHIEYVGINESSKLNLNNIYFFDAFFETIRYKYNKEMDKKLEQREISDYFVEWVYYFNFLKNNFFFSRTKRRQILIKNLIKYNLLINLKIKNYSSYNYILLDFFKKKKFIEGFSFNIKFFNRKLNKVKKGEKIYYNNLLRLQLLPYIRFFLFNKYLYKKFFNIFNLFSNIYFLCSILFSLIRKMYKFKILSIYKFKNFLNFINSLNSGNFYLNDNQFLEIIFIIKKGFIKKKIKFKCFITFFLNEALYFIFNLLLNITFDYTGVFYLKKHKLFNKKKIFNLFKSSNQLFILKGSLNLNINFNLLLSRLSFLINDNYFYFFLKKNLVLFFDSKNKLKLHNKLYFLLYNFYFSYFDININKKLLFNNFNNYKFKFLSNNTKFFNTFYEFSDFFYFRVFNKFYIFLKKNIIKKDISINLLKLLKYYFFSKVYSLKFLNSKKKFINDYFLKNNYNYFLFLLKNLNLINYNKYAIILKKKIYDFFFIGNFINYFFNIYIFMFSYKGLYSLRLIFKNLYIYFFKYYFKNINKLFIYLFVYFKPIKLQFLNFKNRYLLYTVVSFWLVLKSVNLLDSFSILNKFLKQNTTRKEDISIEKSLETPKVRQYLKLWNLINIFNLTFNNFIYYNNDYFLYVLKPIKINGAFCVITPNFFFFENPYFEFNFNIDRFFLDYIDIYELWYYLQILNTIINTRFFFELHIIKTLIEYSFYFENMRLFFFIVEYVDWLKLLRNKKVGNYSGVVDYLDEEYKLYTMVESYIGPISSEEWFAPNIDLLDNDADDEYI